MSSSAPIVRIDERNGREVDLFERFLDEVAHRHLSTWLPAERSLILDLSPASRQLLRLMLDAGHDVVHPAPSAHRLDIRRGWTRTSGLTLVRAEPLTPTWLRDESVDAVVAEGCALSDALAAEVTIEQLHRVLRPGGRLLVSVDSLVAGLARLADDGRWAELADVPAADVVLIPADGGRVTRCFWPEEIHGMLSAAGFTVEWIRPRTVLAEETVTRALRHDPGQLDSLVTTELALESRRQGESIGRQLLASAIRI